MVEVDVQFTYKITRAGPEFSLPYRVAVFVDGVRETDTIFTLTKWGARYAARKFKRKWIANFGKDVIVEEGDL